MIIKKRMFGIVSAMLIATTLSIALPITLSIVLTTSLAFAGDSNKHSNKNVSDELVAGKALAFSRKKGNCLACHTIKGGTSPGTIGPPLVKMKARYPDKKKLHDQIWDASKRNSETSMPLFGTYEILTEDELNKVTDYIYSL